VRHPRPIASLPLDTRDALTISELAEASGVSIASVKFYLREGLLQSGNPERKHRAYYDAKHVERLRLIRTLREVGGLSVAAIREVVETIPAGNITTVALLAKTLDAMLFDREKREVTVQEQRKLGELRSYLATRDIEVRAQSPALLELCRTVEAVREISGLDIPLAALEPYIAVMREIAQIESDPQMLQGDAQTVLWRVVAGTILWERVLVNLRRIIHEHLATQVFKTEASKRKASRR
jgi:DNA-binding transcriptional MerR regulator